MAHCAKINTDNIVERVSVVDNENLLNEEGIEEEALGIAYLNKVHGSGITWVQTSYNNNIRKNYAGIGHTYDSSRDAFIAQQPYPSWILDESTCQWEAPVAYPDDDKRYEWDEDITNWVEM